jgi:hypothetical protein
VMHKSVRLFPFVVMVAFALSATGYPSRALSAPLGYPSRALSAPRTVIEFFARTPHGVASCAIYDGYGGGAEAFCESYLAGRQSKATVNAKGKVSICASRNPRTDSCGLGNAGLNTPTFGYGRRVTIGRFGCSVLHNGVMCTAISSGRGFLFNPTRAVRVGPTSKRG